MSRPRQTDLVLRLAAAGAITALAFSIAACWNLPQAAFGAGVGLIIDVIAAGILAAGMRADLPLAAGAAAAAFVVRLAGLAIIGLVATTPTAPLCAIGVVGGGLIIDLIRWTRTALRVPAHV